MIPPADARWLARLAPEDQRETMAARRRAGEPLQYVLGAWAFRTLELAVDPRALIPRPETEQVVEVALAELRAARPPAGVGRRPDPAPDRTGPPAAGAQEHGVAPQGSGAGAPGGPVVVDLGTGSGAVALSVAVERPDAEVWATDVDPAALALATENAARTGADVALRQGSWYEALPAELRGRVDLVVSNPPYVSEAEWPGLEPEVRREPRQALVAGAGSDGTPGLAGVEAVLQGAPGWLLPGGAVVVELAPYQAAAAARMARAAGLAQVRVAPDLAGRDRMVVARAPGVGAPTGPDGHSTAGVGMGPHASEEVGVGAPTGPKRQ